MRKKSVALVELHVFEKITPLASGYLQAYATADPDVGAAHTFHIYSNTVMAPLNEVAGEVVALDADVYAFSCYVWTWECSVRWSSRCARRSRGRTSCLVAHR